MTLSSNAKEITLSMLTEVKHYMLKLGKQSILDLDFTLKSKQLYMTAYDTLYASTPTEAPIQSTRFKE